MDRQAGGGGAAARGGAPGDDSLAASAALGQNLSMTSLRKPTEPVALQCAACKVVFGTGRDPVFCIATGERHPVVPQSMP